MHIYDHKAIEGAKKIIQWLKTIAALINQRGNI